MNKRWMLMPGLLASAGSIAAPKEDATRIVAYGPQPKWIAPRTSVSESPLPPGAPVRVVYVDSQFRVGPRGEEAFQAYRIKVLTPDALAVGNIAVTWSPGSERMTIHRLAIIRDGKPIDVLATQKFTVLQRENNLEKSMLDGELTASLQTSGLQVGDEIEFAATKFSRDPNLGEQPQGFMQFPILGSRGVYRLRVLWPRDLDLKFRTTPDMPAARDTDIGGEHERVYEIIDPDSVVIPEGAPLRFLFRRNAQYSSYPSWDALSHRITPMFLSAAQFNAGSPVRAEAARIAQSTTDPTARMMAALRLVQEQIRYVYVGLNGGNYRPATADETWQRRFGDCKAKTALLLALLNEFSIPAEAVLVNAQGGDGIDQRLPTPTAFDHVVVRATIDRKNYWLDGTRFGDRSAAALLPPPTRWALPLRTGPTSLEPVAPVAPRRPQVVTALEIDASAGFDKPARVHAQQTFRGDEIITMRAQLAGLAPSDADRMQATIWRQQYDWVEPDKTTWRFDDTSNTLTLMMEGEGKVAWEGNADAGRHFDIPGAGFNPPSTMKRPKEQDQTAPWTTDFPRFRCWATSITLPSLTKGRHWEFRSKPVDRTLGGVAYWRVAQLDNGVMKTVMSRRVLVPEIDAADARTVNEAVSSFDNKISDVYEMTGVGDTQRYTTVTPSMFGSLTTFAGAEPPCMAPSK